MTTKPMTLKMRLEHQSGRNATMPGFKTDLADMAFVQTAVTLNQLQADPVKHINKVEEVELSE